MVSTLQRSDCDDSRAFTQPTISFNSLMIRESQWQSAIVLLPIESLCPNSLRLRQTIDEAGIEKLGQSISAKGLLQPIIVRKHAGRVAQFEIIVGERRWYAAKRAKRDRVPVVVLDISDADALELGLIENLQREDLTAIELASGYQRLISDFGYSQQTVAQRVGKSRSHVANTLRLLTLPAGIREMVQDGLLSAGHGRALLTAEDPEKLATQIVANALSVRETEALAQRRAITRTVPKLATMSRSSEPPVDPSLSARLGYKVTVSYHGQHGRLIIHFDGLEQLTQLVKRLEAALIGRREPAEASTEIRPEAKAQAIQNSSVSHTNLAVDEASSADDDELFALVKKYNLPRPIRWNERTYGPKPESQSYSESGTAVG